ncbi:MAG: hypothetical protein ACK55Z_03195, partial [bacterium]
MCLRLVPLVCCRGAPSGLCGFVEIHQRLHVLALGRRSLALQRPAVSARRRAPRARASQLLAACHALALVVEELGLVQDLVTGSCVRCSLWP